MVKIREQVVSKEGIKIIERELTKDEINLSQESNKIEKLHTELLQLLYWFESYDNQVKQYERCQRLGISFDKDIKKLDNEAKTNQERISEIRKLLKQEERDVTNTKNSENN